MIIRNLGLQPYEPVWRAMQQFTQQRDQNTQDELWVLQHQAVYTQGMNGKAQHVLNTDNIPLIKIDRGGQVTYHGPGQLIIYLLFDLKRHGWGVRHLVSVIEQSIIQLLTDYGIEAKARADAPGVYVAGAKIAALGLRVRRSCSFHGLSLNVNMDLRPFNGINPCGYQGLQMTQLSEQGVDTTLNDVAEKLITQLRQQLTLNDEVQLLDQLPVMEMNNE